MAGEGYFSCKLRGVAYTYAENRKRRTEEGHWTNECKDQKLRIAVLGTPAVRHAQGITENPPKADDFLYLTLCNLIFDFLPGVNI